MKHALTAILILAALPSLAQKPDRIKFEANSLQNVRRNGTRFKVLRDNVVFRQKNTTIYCDSSYYFDKKGMLEAFSRVKLYQEDSVTIDSDKLIYDGNVRLAQFRNNVVYKEGSSMTLHTDYLDYDMSSKSANYYEGGTLVDEENTLTSNLGFYSVGGVFMSFKTDVVLTSPNYTLYSDTLTYNSLTKNAETFGPTKIVKKDGSVLNSQGGIFNTRTDESIFKNGIVESDNYIMTGDTLFFDDTEKYYESKKNVELVSKEDSIITYGDFGYYDEISSISKVFKNALLEKLMQKDTFFLTADTLVFINDSLHENRRILAYYNVKFVKGDISGITDSLVYHFGDSVITMHRDPVLWDGQNQIVGSTMKMFLADNRIEKMTASNKSFIISKDTIGNFNQIKGRQMTAYFKDSEIDKIDVYGNGESVYFALDDENNSVMGMNKITCSNISVFFKNRAVDNITFYVKPEGRFIPPHEIEEPDMKLRGFSWRENERPQKEKLLGKWKNKVRNRNGLFPIQYPASMLPGL